MAAFPLPLDTPPMEARAAEALPQEPGWQFEPKWDGFRCLAFRGGPQVELRAKSGKLFARYFPEVTALLRRLEPNRFVLDGELAIPVGETLSFNALQMRLHPAESRIRKLAAETPAAFILFDMLARETGESLLRAALVERRAALEAFHRSVGSHEDLRLSPYTHRLEEARRWLDSSGGALDGVIAKRLDGIYQPGERAMLKVKKWRTADCVVGGFRFARNSRLVGSLLLGLYNEAGKLDHVGFAATLHDPDRKALTERLEAIVLPPGFTGNAPGARADGAPSAPAIGSRCARNWSSRSVTTTSAAAAFVMAPGLCVGVPTRRPPNAPLNKSPAPTSGGFSLRWIDTPLTPVDLMRRNRSIGMPRASWRGFLRLSLVSCPVYLSPATTRTKPIRLHQVRRPAPAEKAEKDLSDAHQRANVAEDLSASANHEEAVDEFDQGGAATRIVLRPHDPRTGEEVEKKEVVKGYQYGRGQFVTFTAAELKALDVESSKIIDLETFVARSEIDPVYFDSAYHLYPDGPIAVEALRVIGAAMAEAGVVGIGRLTLSRRERMVMVEPRGAGMALFTLRAAAEVRATQFGAAEGELDAEMVAIAGAIIRQRIGKFDPSTFRDRYQEALQQLIAAKLKGVAIKPLPVAAPPPVIDLMAALKRSLAKEKPKPNRASAAAEKGSRPASDRRQAAMLLPLAGGRKRKEEPATIVPTRRRKA